MLGRSATVEYAIRLPQPQFALVAVSGGMVLLQGVAAVTGPVIARLFMDTIGASGLLVFAGGVQVIIAAYGLVRIYLVEGPGAEEKGDFTPVPINPVVAELELAVYEDAALSDDQDRALAA